MRSRTVSFVFFLLLAFATSAGLLPLIVQGAGGVSCGMPIAAGLGTAFLLTCIALGVVLVDTLMRSVWNRFVDFIDDAPVTTIDALLEPKEPSERRSP
jgi:hypothetical protein